MTTPTVDDAYLAEVEACRGDVQVRRSHVSPFKSDAVLLGIGPSEICARLYRCMAA